MQRPTGIVAFLFTDIEGSTQLWERDEPAMERALERHDQLVRGAIESGGGVVFKTVGDAFCAAFDSAASAALAATSAQTLLARESWDGLVPLRARMAIHVGVAHERDNDYFGRPSTVSHAFSPLATAARC